MPEPVTKEDIAATIDMAAVIKRDDPAEAARQLAYIPPADATRARKQLGLESYAKDEADERRKIRAREATPPLVAARGLPSLSPNVFKDQPGTWADMLESGHMRGQLVDRGKIREEAVREALTNIGKGYALRLVQIGSQLMPELSVRYPDDVLSEAWSRVGEADRAKWGPERLRRLSELVAWKVGIANGSIPRDTPPPFRPDRDEDRFTGMTAQVILMARAAAPYQILDARNLNTAILYGARLADIDQDMRAAVGVLKTLAVGASLLLLPLGGAVSAALVRAGFSVGTAHFLGGLAMWRTFSLAHKLQQRGARALNIPTGAEGPYANLVDAVKDLVFAVPQIPGLMVFALIIADFLGYLELPIEAPAPAPAPERAAEPDAEEWEFTNRYLAYTPRELAQLPAPLVQRILFLREKLRPFFMERGLTMSEAR